MRDTEGDRILERLAAFSCFLFVFFVFITSATVDDDSRMYLYL